MGVNSLPNTVTRQRRDCDLNPGPTAPESQMTDRQRDGQTVATQTPTGMIRALILHHRTKFHDDCSSRSEK